MAKLVEDTDNLVEEPVVQAVCPDHPKYRGLRKPRSGCEVCMGIYESNNTKESRNKNGSEEETELRAAQAAYSEVEEESVVIKPKKKIKSPTDLRDAGVWWE